MKSSEGPFSEVQETIFTLEMVRDSVEPLYEPKVPYHGIKSHIDYALENAMMYCAEAEKHGLKPNRLAVGLMVLYHDVGISHKLLGIRVGEFEWDEEYAVYMARQDMASFGFDSALIDEVAAGILKTKQGTTVTTLNEAIACRADISNAEDSFLEFTNNASRYRRELEEIFGKPLAFRDYVAGTRLKLGAFILRDRPLSDWGGDAEWDRDEQWPEFSRFTIRAIENLKNYCKGSSRQVLTVPQFIAELQRDLSSEVVA